jgi:hypothetical protein
MNLHQIDMTPEEQEQLEWCFAALNEEQIEDCFTEAAEIAGAELNPNEAGIQLRRHRGLSCAKTHHQERLIERSKN